VQCSVGVDVGEEECESENRHKEEREAKNDPYGAMDSLVPCQLEEPIECQEDLREDKLGNGECQEVCLQFKISRIPAIFRAPLSCPDQHPSQSVIREDERSRGDDDSHHHGDCIQQDHLGLTGIPALGRTLLHIFLSLLHIFLSLLHIFLLLDHVVDEGDGQGEQERREDGRDESEGVSEEESDERS